MAPVKLSGWKKPGSKSCLHAFEKFSFPFFYYKEEIIPVFETKKDKVQPCKPILFLTFLTPTWISLLKFSYSCVITTHNTPAGKRAWIVDAVLCQGGWGIRNPRKTKLDEKDILFLTLTNRGSLVSNPTEWKHSNKFSSVVQPKKEQCHQTSLLFGSDSAGLPIWKYTCTHVYVYHMKTINIVIEVQSHEGIYLILHCLELDC